MYAPAGVKTNTDYPIPDVMYIAMANGYFAESDIVVKIVTIETGGGHTNAVLSGQAFAFIGGPEHNAFAKAKGAELRAVVHCVDRGNVYLCAAKGHDPKDRDWPNYFKGKAIAVGAYGGTPNSIMVTTTSAMPTTSSSSEEVMIRA